MLTSSIISFFFDKSSKSDYTSHSPRVVAKKIVSRLRFSLGWSPCFVRDLEQNLSQSFPMPGMQGYQASRLQDGGCSTRKENTINKCSKLVFFSITLLIRVAPILTVVRN